MRNIIKSIPVLFLLIAFQIAVAQPESIDSSKSRVAQTSGDERIETLIQLSKANRTYDFDACISIGLKAVMLAEKKKNFNLQALAIKSIGVSYLFEGELVTAIQYFEKSLDLYTNNNHLQGMANCLNNIGLVYLYRGNYIKAAEYYQLNYDIVKALDNKPDIASVLIQLGNVNYYRSNFHQALDNYYQAMLIYSEIEDLSGKADAYYSLGIIYSELKNFEKALEFYRFSESTYRKTGNLRDLSHVLNNMAKIYSFEYKEFETAHLLYKQTLELKKQLNDKIGIALLYNNIGTLFGNMKKYQKAIEYFNKSKLLYEEIESKSGLMMVIFNIGQVYDERGDVQLAIEMYSKSLKMAKTSDEVSYINQNYEALFHIYAQTCNYDQFDKYYRLFAIGKDTLIDRLYQAEMAEVEARYKVEELLRDTSTLLENNEKKAKEIWKYKLILAGIVCLFFLFLLFLFFNGRKK